MRARAGGCSCYHGGVRRLYVRIGGAETSYSVGEMASLTLDASNILLIDGWTRVGIFPLGLVESILIAEEEEVKKPYSIPSPSIEENVSYSENDSLEAPANFSVVDEEGDEGEEEGEETEIISTPQPQKRKRKIPKKKLRDPVFWITGLTITGSVATAVAEIIPPEFSAIAGSAAGVMYLAARGINKLRAGEILEPPSPEGG